MLAGNIEGCVNGRRQSENVRELGFCKRLKHHPIIVPHKLKNLIALSYPP